MSGYGGRQRSFNTRQNMYAPGAGSQLQPVDWTRIDLKEMKKDVYVENPSAANRNEIEIDEWMSENEILLKGNEIPKPILSFAEATFPGSSIFLRVLCLPLFRANRKNPTRQLQNPYTYPVYYMAHSIKRAGLNIYIKNWIRKDTGLYFASNCAHTCPG